MLTRKLSGLILSLFMCGTLLADTVALNPEHPQRYVVVEGDTLWDIAARFLRDPWLWPETWHNNPQIANPHLIYPGDVISLTYVDGEPRLVLERNGRPTVKLSPQARVVALDTAIPTIPMDAIRQFLSRTRIVTDEELAQAPYMVESTDAHLVTSADNRVYVRGINSSDHIRFGVFRPGDEYRSPRFRESLGREAVYIGEAQAQKFGDPSTFMLTSTTREALIGDRLFPIEQEDLIPHFVPHAPQRPVEGRIISVLDGVTQIGQHQVVVVDLGVRDGMERGHVLAIHQAGQVVPDTVSNRLSTTVKLPDERAGVLMIFRTFERVSYALVMNTTRPVHILDIVRNP